MNSFHSDWDVPSSCEVDFFLNVTQLEYSDYFFVVTGNVMH